MMLENSGTNKAVAFALVYAVAAYQLYADAGALSDARALATLGWVVVGALAVAATRSMQTVQLDIEEVLLAEYHLVCAVVFNGAVGTACGLALPTALPASLGAALPLLMAALSLWCYYATHHEHPWQPLATLVFTTWQFLGAGAGLQAALLQAGHAAGDSHGVASRLPPVIVGGVGWFVVPLVLALYSANTLRNELTELTAELQDTWKAAYLPYAFALFLAATSVPDAAAFLQAPTTAAWLAVGAAAFALTHYSHEEPGRDDMSLSEALAAEWYLVAGVAFNSWQAVISDSSKLCTFGADLGTNSASYASLDGSVRLAMAAVPFFIYHHYHRDSDWRTPLEIIYCTLALNEVVRSPKIALIITSAAGDELAAFVQLVWLLVPAVLLCRAVLRVAHGDGSGRPFFVITREANDERSMEELVEMFLDGEMDPQAEIGDGSGSEEDEDYEEGDGDQRLHEDDDSEEAPLLLDEEAEEDGRDGGEDDTEEAVASLQAFQDEDEDDEDDEDDEEEQEQEQEETRRSARGRSPSPGRAKTKKTDFASMKVTELKAALKKKKLSTSGNKSALVARLKKAHNKLGHGSHSK